MNRIPTEQLIQVLAHEVPVVGAHAASRRLALGAVAGAAVTAAVVFAALGVRPDLRLAIAGFTFWMKCAYCAWLGGVALTATLRLARPAGRAPLSWRGITLPVLSLALVSLVELTQTPASAWLGLLLGKNWVRCLWLLLSLSLPILAGLLWALRRLAPTRLRSAGAAAGLAAGACSAAIYSLHCPEVSALFVLAWYSLALLLAASIGAALGPRLLRW